ncbi:RNA polymerase sigma factor [Dyadobacter chenwenxiniae]|uniref:RNA polymerase sigma factor n=1 Tax=Dyadobacter chenwenxiniae TaxID=2906456 RepID=A0A9X1PQZ3_9BACT|nr:RNA polymerase sigma factor [Dyadobacter chenwenxiniae]MCF0051196.1 RNA polymerase sigma factor [Dyadobacter chenwenxiniae]MCF0064514.1 RNA polymerase sigma factor [Dyadobacter chenwenxiniae]UON82283.1 RNA polymerase sigma factor [Dyadobacter chenwenxiniae]
MVDTLADYAWHNVTDEELVKLFLESGNNRYFEKLYDRYALKVFKKCLSLTRDVGRAEDLTHDVFLKLVFKMGTFKKGAKFSTWLYSVTYNHCMDLMRSNKKRVITVHEESADCVEHMDLDSLFGVEEVNTKILRQALDHLQPEEKALLYMKYMDDRSIRYIAGNAHLTESAVKMRLMRSREKLRRVYLEIAYLGNFCK